MWKLTVERKYNYEVGERQSNATDRMYFEADYLDDLENIITLFSAYATEGSFKYIIEYVCEKDGEE